MTYVELLLSLEPAERAKAVHYMTVYGNVFVRDGKAIDPTTVDDRNVGEMSLHAREANPAPILGMSVVREAVELP